MAQIDVRILDRDYKLSVSDDDRTRLLEAVAVVDEKMRAIRDAGKIAGLDRIAVMAQGRLVADIHVPFERPRQRALRYGHEFNALCGQVRECMDRELAC